MLTKTLRPRAELDRAFKAIQDALLRLGDRVDRAIAGSIESLLTYDHRSANQIIANDQIINTKRYQIEADCLKTIATQQPAASDLRRVIATMHTAGELERIGDHAAGIAKLVGQLAQPPRLPLLSNLNNMSQATRRMLRSALNALVLDNVELAERVYHMDAEIDQYYQQIFRIALTNMQADRSTVGEATYLMWIAHNLERIGDRCTNLCERTFSNNGVHPAETH